MINRMSLLLTITGLLALTPMTFGQTVQVKPGDNQNNYQVQHTGKRLGIIAENYHGDKQKNAGEVTDGVRVRDVIKDGPADRAGIQKGDLIVEIDGKAANNLFTLHQIINHLESDRSVTVKIVR